MTPVAYVGIALALSLAANAVLHADKKALKAELNVKDQQIQTIRDAVDMQANALGIIDRLATASAARAKTLEAVGIATAKETKGLRDEINNLRTTEEAAARLDPHNRSLASHKRLCRSVRRLASDGTAPGCDDPAASGADDPRRTPISPSDGADADSGDNGEGTSGS